LVYEKQAKTYFYVSNFKSNFVELQHCNPAINNKKCHLVYEKQAKTYFQYQAK